MASAPWRAAPIAALTSSASAADTTPTFSPVAGLVTSSSCITAPNDPIGLAGSLSPIRPAATIPGVNSAPLAASYREVALWQAQVSLPSLDVPTLPAEADAVVVGGGYCGLAAAWTLAQRGRQVVLVEAKALGFGASTRNGGMVIPELKAGPAKLEQQYGSLGRRMFQAVGEAFDFVESLISEHSIACDYQRTGQLYLAHHPRAVAALRAYAEEYAAAGEAVELIDGSDLGNEIGSTVFSAAAVFERTGAVHPARLHQGLVSLASRAGVHLHDFTEVTRLERPKSGGFRVVTRRGAIAARDVIVAANAYIDGLIPRLARRVLPIGSYVIATRPLDPGLADAVSPRRRMFVDTKNFLFYWRLSPDDRMVFGGRKSLGSTTVAEARDYLYRSMVRIHPQLSGLEIEYAWGGDVAMTLDRLPHVGYLDKVLYATGCNGSGVALNTWMGARVGGMVCGDDPPPFAELRHRAIPASGLRRCYLPFVSAWFRFEDRFGLG
ncbi:MAG: FAD-binding oxidoreductase [Actinobacteria bacterium]|nr:MAG: FAD-binding oxidoreductase [Actinomycetota bacterium]